MIVFIDLLLWITAVVNVVSCEYQLAKYAPQHDNYEPMRYSYAYDVKNPSTGDHKHHWENRDGDAVQGEYGLIDADGYMRTVRYTSHPHRGFQATVKRQHISPKQQHITTESKQSTRLYDNVRYALTVTHGPGHSQVESASSTELFKTQRPTAIQERLGHSTIPNSLPNTVKTHEKQIVKKNVPETQFSFTTNCNESPELCVNPVNVPIDKNMHIIQDDWKRLYIIPQEQAQYPYGPQFINANLNNYRQVYNFPESIVQNTDNVPSNDNNSENQKKVEYALSLVQSQPHIQTQLQQVHGYQNDIRDIPVPSALEEINSRNGNANVQDDNMKLQYALSLINKQPHIKSQLEHIHGSQSISAHNIVPSYKDYSYGQSISSNNPQRNIPVLDGTRMLLRNNEQNNNNNDRIVLSQQTKLPLIFVNIQGKYGLPFYPTTKELMIPPENEAKFGYEGIPVADGRRFPSGATSETIYNAGDPTADREQEELVRQLNETCVYFRYNETIEGTEDGTKDNIFNAGDYTAQREEEELIRSTNVTCLNFTADASTNFASGFTLAQYCSQCLQNNTDIDEYNDSGANNANVPDNNYQVTKNSQINDNTYVQNEENRYRTETQQLESARVIYPNYGYLNDADQNVDLAQLYIRPLVIN